MPRRTRSHKLTRTEEGTCEDTETELARKGYSLSEGHKEKELVRHRKKRAHEEHSLPGENRGGIGDDTGRSRQTEAHSHSGDGRGRDLSGHGKKLTGPSRTHILETAEGGTCQDTETNRLTEVHSPTGDGRGRDLSGHRKKLTDRGALTSWRRQRERLVRTRKQTNQLRHTHFLETAKGETCRDTERN